MQLDERERLALEVLYSDAVSEHQRSVMHDVTKMTYEILHGDLEPEPYCDVCHHIALARYHLFEDDDQ